MSRRQMNWNEWLKKLERENSFFSLLDCITVNFLLPEKKLCTYIRNWYAVAVPCRKISIRYIPSTQRILVNVSRKMEKQWMD